MSRTRSILLLGCLLVLALLLLSPFASKSPDGLMKFAGQQGLEKKAESGSGSRPFHTILAGFIGALSVFAFSYGFFRLLTSGQGRKKR